MWGRLIKDKKPVFLYKMVGSWGFSPHPESWVTFLRERRNMTDPRMRGLVSNSWFNNDGKVWTNWSVLSGANDGSTIFTLNYSTLATLEATVTP